MIPGGDEGRARRGRCPAAVATRALFSPDPGGRCSVTARKDGGRPRGAFLPADLAESPAAEGRKQRRAATAEGDGENA